MTTIKDIANYTGVSPTTVSNVIHGRDSKVSPETKKKVKQALDELNYASNMGGRLLAKHGSRIIGVIIQDEDSVTEKYDDNPYHGELIQALEHEIREANYFMMFHRVTDFEMGERLVKMWDLEGLIISGARADDVRQWQERLDVPMVFLDSYGKEANQAKLNVGIDDYQGAYDMIRYMAKKGHRHILYLAKGVSPNEWQGVDDIRSQGALSAAKTYGVKVELVSAPSTYRHYQSFLKNLVKENFYGSTAIFFSSDLLAVQSVSTFYELGIRVPDQLSVGSFDGTPYSFFATPQITAVKQDVKEKSRLATKLLIESIHNEPLRRVSQILPTILIEGQSIARL